MGKTCNHVLWPTCGCPESAPEPAVVEVVAPPPKRGPGRPTKAELAAREAPAPPTPLVQGLIGPTAPTVLAAPRRPEPPRLVGFPKPEKKAGRPVTPWLLREREKEVVPEREPTIKEQVLAAVAAAQNDPEAMAA